MAVDLQKGFYTAGHNILLGKLKHCGIRGVAYSWFESYRKQYVSVNGYNSKHFPSPLGVPQSSVLRPLLFLTHIIQIQTLKSAKFNILLMKQISYISMTQSRNKIKLLIPV